MDDEKVIDRTIDYFEAVFPGENTYIVLLPKNKSIIHYIKNPDRVKLCNHKSSEWHSLIKNANQYSEIIVHFLNPIKIDFINSIHHPKITWILWGSDLYQDLLSYKGYRLYYDEDILSKANLISKARKYLPYISNLLDRRRLSKRLKAISKINRVAAFEPDYKLLLEYYPEFSHLGCCDFFYYPIDAILGDYLKDKRCSSSRIMIGNSASPTGNHEHAFEILQNENIKEEIIVPLSYGPSSYKQYIQDKAKAYKSLDLKILSEFLPLEEYNQTLLSCANFVYANYRQEAVGNILIALYLGGKIFLSEKNPLYKYFINLGLSIFTLDKINNERIKVNLTEEEYVNNKNIVLSMFNYDKLISTIAINFSENNLKETK